MKKLAHMVGLAMLVAGGAVRGQTNTFEIVTSNVVTPQHPEATVEVWALFDPDQFAFFRGGWDFVASPDVGEFLDSELILDGPQSSAGEIEPGGDSIIGILASQFHSPLNGIWADESDPILLWRTNWSTDDFTHRTISLKSETSLFDVYTDAEGAYASFLDAFGEGSGAILVVPSPGAAAMLGLTLAASRWRRR